MKCLVNAVAPTQECKMMYNVLGSRCMALSWLIWYFLMIIWWDSVMHYSAGSWLYCGMSYMGWISRDECYGRFNIRWWVRWEKASPESWDTQGDHCPHCPANPAVSWKHSIIVWRCIRTDVFHNVPLSYIVAVRHLTLVSHNASVLFCSGNAYA